MHWDEALTSCALGLLSGGSIVVARRVPLLGSAALVPLAALLIEASPGHVALAAALAGALSCAATVWTPTLRAIAPLAALAGALGWTPAFTLAALAIPSDQPDWLLLALPLAAALSGLPARALGAPRWSRNPLACSQETHLVMVHAAKLGGDATVSALLGATSALFALLLTDRGSPLFLLLTAAVVAGILGLGWFSLRRSEQRNAKAKTLRVAAVVVDGPPRADGLSHGLWPAESLDYRDVEGSARRYAPMIDVAAKSGARLIVLPEVSVYLDAKAQPRWFELVHGWAQQYGVAIVAPFFNAALPRNELALFDTRGVAGEHEKQHPARGMEPPRTQRRPVGPHTLLTGDATISVSTAICVDLDYADTAQSARAAGALLAAPSNDWFGGFEKIHQRSAVWTAVLAGVPIVRATGHGVSAIYDSAGHVLAQQTSQHGPVVLVADVPLP